MTRLSDPLAGASIAVLTAHAGFHPEGRFSSLSLTRASKISAADLAAAVRNVGIVVHFVGRVVAPTRILWPKHRFTPNGSFNYSRA